MSEVLLTFEQIECARHWCMTALGSVPVIHSRNGVCTLDFILAAFHAGADPAELARYESMNDMTTKEGVSA